VWRVCWRDDAGITQAGSIHGAVVTAVYTVVRQLALLLVLFGRGLHLCWHRSGSVHGAVVSAAQAVMYTCV
jgi:hypothetical protein